MNANFVPGLLDVKVENSKNISVKGFFLPTDGHKSINAALSKN